MYTLPSKQILSAPPPTLLFLSAMSCGSSESHPRLFRPYVLPCLVLTTPQTHALFTPHVLCTGTYKVHVLVIQTPAKHVPVSTPLGAIHYCSLSRSLKIDESGVRTSN